MSARSPRGSLSGASSAEVALDFEDSLKDLQTNNRYEISNLTIIAKENTEHAQAISKSLEKHIKTIAPTRKLPALYVLDSVIKNVGTPYTVYLGRNLYSTFMEAYTLVDANTRRAMDGMLKTWKEPVPGSLDTRPVFPPEVVRPIENALIKAKTAAIQHQRQVQPHGQYRNTPTPPQYNGQYAPPGQPHAQSQHLYGSQQPTPQSVFQHTPVQQQPYPFAPPQQQHTGELETLKRDLDGVIESTKSDFARTPLDAAIRQKLSALLQLQTVLSSQQLQPKQLQAVRASIYSLAPPSSALPQPQPAPQPVVSQPLWRPPVQTNLPIQPFPAPVPYAQAPSVQPQPQAPPQASGLLLPPSALNGLQALLQQNQKPTTPQMRAEVPSLQNATHNQLNTIQTQAAAAASTNGADLMAALSKAGIIQRPPPANPPPQTTAPPPNDMGALLAALQSRFTPQTNPLPAQHLPIGKPRIPMSAASLKTFRPELIRGLYADQPNQCATCGRRFLADAAGREKKARHLDWHFRTNNRVADPQFSRGRYRNWFVDEMAWIMQTEFDVSTTVAGEEGEVEMGKKEAKKKGAEELWVRAPPGVTSRVCPICQEEMRSSHPEDLQDWVFMNAVVNGGRITHATCLAEMAQGAVGGSAGGSLAAVLGGGAWQRQRSATPERALGKRKAEWMA